MSVSITVIGLVTAFVQIVLLKSIVAHLGEHRAVLAGSVLLLASARGEGITAQLSQAQAIHAIQTMLAVTLKRLPAEHMRQGPLDLKPVAC